MKKNKVLSVALAALIAIGLWIYVVTTVATEDTQWVRNIPVTFINEDGLFSDRNLTLTEGRNAAVDLKFRGSRQDLLKLNNTNILITVDLNQVTEPDNWTLSYEYTLPETVNAGNITVESRSAYTVSVVVDELSVREIPVRATFVGDVAEGYMAESIELEQNTIDISGPQELVTRVSYAQVILERTNLSKTVSDMLSVTLMDENDEPVVSDELKCSVDKIGAIMAVNMVKEIPLTVQLIDGGGATADHAVVDIVPSTVTIKGAAEDLQGLNSISLGTVDLSSIEETYKETFNVVIPNGMVNMTQETAEVQVALKNLKSKSFVVTNLEIANAPESLKATLGTLSLTVKLRGDSEVIQNVTASNIRAVADLSSLGNTTGQFSVPVDIFVDGFSDVGATGTYTVLVSISEPVDEESVVVAVAEESLTGGVTTGDEAG